MVAGATRIYALKRHERPRICLPDERLKAFGFNRIGSGRIQPWIFQAVRVSKFGSNAGVIATSLDLLIVTFVRLPSR